MREPKGTLVSGAYGASEFPVTLGTAARRWCYVVGRLVWRGSGMRDVACIATHAANGMGRDGDRHGLKWAQGLSDIPPPPSRAL
jgi:hypothetical protein